MKRLGNLALLLALVLGIWASFAYLGLQLGSLFSEQSLTQIHRERILMRHLAKVDDQYDLIILDCPPNLSLTSTNAMMAAADFA